MSCKFDCKVDGRKCNSNQKWKNHKCLCKKCKNPKKVIFRILLYIVVKVANI